MSKGKVALGAVIGAAAGLVAGILTAPKSGKETRADIKKKADEIKKEAAKKVDETKKEAGKFVDEAKDTVEDYKNRTVRAYDSAKKEFKKESDK